MNKTIKTISGTAFTSLFFLVTTVKSHAQVINVDSINVESKFGKIEGLPSAFVFVFNLFKWLGWAGVIVGVGLAIFGLIYKLFSTDNEEAMQTVQGYITKAVIIVLAGILLLSAGFIVTVIGELLGVTLDFGITTAEPSVTLN